MEPYKTIIAGNTPQGLIDVPILISHGAADRLIPIEGSAAEAARRCTEGENVQFVPYWASTTMQRLKAPI